MRLFSQRTVINLILVIALIVFGGVGVLSHLEIKSLMDSNWWVSHTHQVIDSVTQSQLALKDADSQVNHFVITNNSQFIQNIPAIIESAEQHIRFAKQLTVDNPRQQRRLEKFSQLIKASDLSLQQTIHMQSTNKKYMTQLEMNPQKNALTVAIAQLYTEIIQQEQLLLKTRDVAVNYKNQKTSVILMVGTLSTEVLLFCCLLLLNFNLSKRNQAEKKLKTTLDDLKRSNSELEQFAYIASHDLQEPLRMVVSYTQLLERRYKDKLDTDAREFINYSVDGAKRMQVLLNNLLIYSRVNRQNKSFELIDFNEVYNDTLLNLDALLSEKKPVITHSKFPTILGDSTQLTQLLQNLLANSLKFMPKNRTPRIQISATLDNNEWVFSVKDNGIGIETQYFEQIFTIFKRLHARAEYPGTGIGLALCKKIVEKHGGRMWLQSKLGKGTTFYFTLSEIKE